MEWVTAAVLSSFLTAIGTELNRLYRMDGLVLNFWRTLWVLLFTIPFLPLIPWPQDPLFYMVSIFVGAVMAVGTTVQLNLAAAQSARASALVQPLKFIALYFLWALIDAAARERLLSDPFETMGAVGVFIAAGWSLTQMRSQDASSRLLVYIGPVALLYATADLFLKMVLDSGHATQSSSHLYALSIATSAVSYASCALFTGALMAIKRHKPADLVLSSGMMKMGATTGLLTLGKLVGFYYALGYAPNPAYVSAIALLMPVWLMAYHKMRGIPDRSNPWSAIVLMACAGVLVFLSQR